ncbi:BREX system P-loop protein BrxC [Bifidobacterium adolescentis]|uniref:BREX system P-loop protein BrxC n=1 Tax=Bifidobacterium adolescentis TaxID=1680 RepID=A0A6I6R0D1_BIFAD|nr:BREX system P-loop protein BrxC [Bifidobacterium adolescentis]QHB62901.1 BREX system P-loop protein BrxC [Bifidobacterium adolescentis]RGQ32433.1 BREX system P-loop protein BrxC [Bifidobacterium adolescentis]RGX59779.1 BREX system P-loop protein BrxC [Bifidobacterium adolescentis]RGX60778.1 BREX system P-loop protein BrxC [Bifidobacterium adolescentis]
MSGQNGVSFKELFNKDIEQSVNGVIKANDEKELDTEVSEYVLTDEIRRNLDKFFDSYNDQSNHEQNGAWISGFFGSGKSHLLKMLSHILGNVPAQLVDKGDGTKPTMGREQIVRTFVSKAEEQDDLMLAGQLERTLSIPATSILFNIDQKADKSNADDALLYAFVRVFDEARGYFGKSPYVAKFERDLDRNGLLDEFKRHFEQASGETWDSSRDASILWDTEISEAYAAATGKPVQDSIMKRYEDTYTMTVGDFADDVNEWLTHQEPNHRILFLVDEVGQFIGEKRELMLSLQSIAEDLAVKTNGRAWVVVTSQEDMDSIVGDRTRQQSYDFSKIQGRFSIRLKLNSADVVEVIQKRLLTKKPEYGTLMDDLWNEQGNNLRTMFEFTGETKRFSVNGRMFDKNDFIASYPFVNYEFGLFQDTLRGMSRFGMFDGRHSSVGERSMLSTVSSALRDSKDETVGALVPFDRLYDGIADAIQSTSNYRIKDAEKRLTSDVRDLGVRLLKVLLLVKHVDGFPATVHNLRILLTDRFGMDVIAFEADIKKALDALEHDMYVQRVGDTYNYLTNEEQDIEQEIKNTDVDPSKETELFKDILLNDVLGGKTAVMYGPQKAPFQYGLKIDQVPQGKQQPIWLDVVTSANEQERKDAVRKDWGNRDTITLVLDTRDGRLADDIRNYTKTDTYLLRTDRKSQSEVRQQIISRKVTANEKLRDDLRERVKKAAADGVFYYNGEPVEVKSTEVRAHVAEGLNVLIGRYYPDFKLLGGVSYTEADLARIIMDASQNRESTLDGTNGTANMIEAPADDVYSYISREKNKKRAINLDDILEQYDKSPYGWPYAAILACVGHLFGTERITLSLDGKPIQRTEAASLLRETKRHGGILVDLPRRFDARKVSALRDFAKDFLNISAGEQPTSASDLAQLVCDRLKNYADELTRLRTNNAKLDFTAQLDEPIEKIRFDAGMATDWLLGDFTGEDTDNGSEELLDLKEEVIDPIVSFLNGSQLQVLETSRQWLKDNEANIASCASQSVAEAYREAKRLADDSNIFRGSKASTLKKTVDTLRGQMDSIVQTEREKALGKAKGIRARIEASDEYRDATAQAQAEALATMDRIEERIRTTSLILAMGRITDELDSDTYPRLINMLAGSKPKPKPAVESTTPTGEAAEAHAPEPQQTSAPVRMAVSLSKIEPPRIKDSLETADDVDDFLDAYRRELMAAIENGKKILL